MEEEKPEIPQMVTDGVACLFLEREHISSEILIHAPHRLFEPLFGKMIAKLRHSLDEIAFGHQDMDWKLSAQDSHQFVNSAANVSTILFQGLSVGLKQLIGSDRHDEAIQRLFFAIFEEKI